MTASQFEAEKAHLCAQELRFLLMHLPLVRRVIQPLNGFSIGGSLSATFLPTMVFCGIPTELGALKKVGSMVM